MCVESFKEVVMARLLGIFLIAMAWGFPPNISTANGEVLCAQMRQVQKALECVFEYTAFVAEHHCDSGGGPWVTVKWISLTAFLYGQTHTESRNDAQQVSYNRYEGATICGGGVTQCMSAKAESYDGGTFSIDQFC